MEVILKEDILTLGYKDEVVNVKKGYARNYLIPQGKAKRANAANLAEFEARRADLERVQGEKLAAAQELAGKLEGVSVEVSRKAGMDGRLFGSVGNADIAEVLVAKGFDIDRSAIRMPDGPLKQVGETSLEVSLHADVLASITVVVKAEQ